MSLRSTRFAERRFKCPDEIRQLAPGQSGDACSRRAPAAVFELLA
jgi:hypothetical protein